MSVHDEILEAVFVGGRAPDEPDIAEHLAGCAPCRERLSDLTRLSAGLSDLATEEREDLEAARRSDDPIDPRFEALLAEKHVRDDRPARSRVLRPLGILAAAAAVLALVLVGRGLWPTAGSTDDPGANPFLGSDRVIELVRPLTLPTLRWTFDLPPEGHYVIEIVDDTDAARGTIVVDRARVSSNEWSPSDSILPVELPEAFVLRLEAYDQGGALLGEPLEERLP